MLWGLPKPEPENSSFCAADLHVLCGGHAAISRALIIAPTRELSEQTHKAIGLLGRRAQIHSASIYGGVGIGGQITAPLIKLNIISACPVPLEHIQRNTIDLSHVRGARTGWADQCLIWLSGCPKIVKHFPNSVKRCFLRYDAQRYKKLANDLLQNPVNIEIGHARR